MKKVLIADDEMGWINFHKGVVQGLLGADVVVDTVLCAKDGYNLVLENEMEPYDYLITDLHMERDFFPKKAGIWLIEQIQSLPSYKNIKIIIISDTPNLKSIADPYNAYCISKREVINSLEKYKALLQ